jgi:hypothetical protein
VTTHRTPPRFPSPELELADGESGPVVTRIVCRGCGNDRTIASIRTTSLGYLYQARLGVRTERPGAIIGPLKERYALEKFLHEEHPYFYPPPQPVPRDIRDYTVEIDYRLLTDGGAGANDARAECRKHGILAVDNATLFDAATRGTPRRPTVLRIPTPPHNARC